MQVQQTDQGGFIDIPPDMAGVIGVAHGSIGILHPHKGGIEVEILPPPSPELIASVREICKQFQEDFEAMKRLGD